MKSLKLYLSLACSMLFLLGLTSTAASQSGEALDFDGLNDRVELPHFPRPTTMTVEAWINTTSSSELTGSESGLVAYYNFKQGVAGGNNAGVTTLIDLTSNNNDGDLQNFALNGSTSNWVNGPPDCSGAAIADQSADANCQATISSADVTGVTDPDGDALTITVSPTTLSLGANTVTVTADDGDGGTCSTDITVNVVDDTPPVVSCSATTPVGDDDDNDDDDGGLQINFSATDNCAVASLTAVIDIGCQQISVEDGDIVEVECDDDDCEVETEDGVLKIQSETATLIVTATDGAGNTEECTQDLCPADEDEGDEGEEEEDADKRTADETTVESSLPEGYALLQNHPNPFNPSTTITFAVPEAGDVTLSIYNLRGQLIQTLHSGAIAAGQHSVVWDGTDARGAKVASGVYLYKLQAKNFVATKKLVFTK